LQVKYRPDAIQLALAWEISVLLSLVGPDGNLEMRWGHFW